MAEKAGVGLSKYRLRDLFARLLRHVPGLATALACAALAASVALAAPAKKTPAWSELTPAQQQALAPLAEEWGRLDAASKRTWLGVAKRYPKMTPIGQKRVQTRIKTWAKLTPEQRREARERYRELTPQQRHERARKWREYQELPPAERARLEASPAANHAQGARSPAPAPAAK